VVREGTLSSWAASRIVVPLARANTEHADQLLVALADAPLSTRELRSATVVFPGPPLELAMVAFRSARDHMVSRPRLFIDALRETGEQRASERLRDGPEGECTADLRSIEAILARLRKRVAALRPLPRALIDATPHLAFQPLRGRNL
jgi:ParB family chromosome partitioning protein